MKRSFLSLAAVVAIGTMAISNSGWAQFGQPAEDAKEISAAEAQKKYPPPKGGYPLGEVTSAPGVIKSPYPPNYTFKTHGYGKDNKPTSVKRGALILDPHANKVFVNP